MSPRAKPKRETDLVITVAGDDPALTAFFATEIAEFLVNLGVARVSNSAEWSQASNDPGNEGVRRLRTLLEIAKRTPTISVQEGE